MTQHCYCKQRWKQDFREWKAGEPKIRLDSELTIHGTEGIPLAAHRQDSSVQWTCSRNKCKRNVVLFKKKAKHAWQKELK